MTTCPDPRWSAPVAVGFCLASVAVFFAIGYSLAAYAYDRLRPPTKENP